MVAVTYKLQELPKLLDLPIVYWLLLICSDKGLVERLSAFLIDIARIQGLWVFAIGICQPSTQPINKLLKGRSCLPGISALTIYLHLSPSISIFPSFAI